MQPFVQMLKEKYMRFPEGKAKALTFSYDDGVEADKRLVAILDKYGLKGTFNLNSERFDIAPQWHGRMTKEETIRTFYGTSHEVAGHGAVHAFLDKISLPEAIREVVACREQLEEMFDTVVDGYAYAYNGYTDEVVDFLKAFGITYARTTQSSLTFALPKDWLRLQPTCHLPGEKSFGTLCEKFFESSPADPANVKHRESWLFYAWGHSFEFDDDCWNVIEDFAARAYQNRDSVWFATNGEIYRYCKAYENLIFSCDGERVFNPSAMSVWLEVRGKTYEVKPNQTLKFDRF